MTVLNPHFSSFGWCRVGT